MKAEFSFVHYSYDPEVLDPFQLLVKMTSLGFVKNAEHHNGIHAFWNQNKTVMMTSVNHDSFCGLDGMGFVLPANVIKTHPLRLKFDSNSDTYHARDPNGNSITVLAEELDISSYHFNVDYDAVLKNTGCGLDRITGVVYHTQLDRISEFYSMLGFRKSTVNRNSLIDAGDRLEIATHGEPSGLYTAMVCDTDDVFRTTSKLVAADVEFMTFDVDQMCFDLRSADHKIRGYNCLATGNIDSFCIENFVPQALPGMDLIIRTRKKFKQISTQSLEVYYGR